MGAGIAAVSARKAGSAVGRATTRGRGASFNDENSAPPPARLGSLMDGSARTAMTLNARAAQAATGKSSVDRSLPWLRFTGVGAAVDGGDAKAAAFGGSLAMTERVAATGPAAFAAWGAAGRRRLLVGDATATAAAPASTVAFCVRGRLVGEDARLRGGAAVMGDSAVAGDSAVIGAAVTGDGFARAAVLRLGLGAERSRLGVEGRTSQSRYW